MTGKKIFFGILGVLFLIVIAGIIVVPRLIDPNNYKHQIIQAVKSATGRDLVINGEMSLSFFPLGFKLPDVTLSNTPGFGEEPLASVKLVRIQAQLMPLLKKRLEVDEVLIEGLTIHLAKDASGKANWQHETHGNAVPTEKEPSNPAPKSSPGQSPAYEYSIGKFVVRDANLVWKNIQSGDSYSVQHLNLETGRVQGNKPFEIHLTLDAEYAKQTKKSHLDLKSTFQTTPGGFKLSSFDLALDDSHLTGAAEAQENPKVVWKFDLQIDDLDADRYIPKSSGTESDSKPKDEPQQSPLIILAGMNGSGSLRIGKLKIAGMKLSDLAIQMRIQDGLFGLGPDEAKLYGGTYNGNSVVDAREEKAVFQLNENLANIQAGPLFKDMQMLEKFSGTGSIELKGTAQGADPERFKKSLDGSASFLLTNGKWQGVNLEKIVQQANQLSAQLKGKSAPAETKAADETLFSKLTATLNFKNGIAQTNDFTMVGNVLSAKATGSADLIRETLNFKMNVTLTTGKNKGLTVPVDVKGTFAKPHYGLDLGDLVQNGAKNAIEKGLDQLFKKKKPKKP